MDKRANEWNVHLGYDVSRKSGGVVNQVRRAVETILGYSATYCGGQIGSSPKKRKLEAKC